MKGGSEGEIVFRRKCESELEKRTEKRLKEKRKVDDDGTKRQESEQMEERTIGNQEGETSKLLLLVQLHLIYCTRH